MEYMFSNKDLRKMIFPLIIEQFLNISIGMIDSVMVAGTGEAAVSAVSLVDTVMILLVNMFTALAAGGGIVAGHAIGRKNREEGCDVAEQTLLFTVSMAIIIMTAMYLFKNWIFSAVFGDISDELLKNCNIYYSIMAASIPFLALYNVGASTCRSIGNSKLPMMMSFIMNIVHLIGNYILINIYGLGVAGAATSSLFSRIFSGVAIVLLLRNKKLFIHFRSFKIKLKKDVLKKIMRIGIPYGIESSLFQIGKILVISLVAELGIASITANAVAGTIGSFALLLGSSLNVAMSIVTAQCVGTGDFEQVKYYTKKIFKYAYGLLAVMNILIMLGLPVILRLYDLTDETTLLVRQLTFYHCICVMTIWPLSFMIPPVLRAANDVAYCMVVSVASMWIFRIAFSYFLVKNLELGILGVWIAMTVDWVIRGVLFGIRYKSGKWWHKYRVNLRM